MLTQEGAAIKVFGMKVNRCGRGIIIILIIMKQGEEDNKQKSGQYHQICISRTIGWPQIVISMKRPFRRGRHNTKGWTMTTKRGIIIWISFNNKINSKASASDNDITKAYFTRSNLPPYRREKRRLLHTLRNGMTPVATLGLRPVFFTYAYFINGRDR